MEPIKIACIGSRDVSPDAIRLMEQIGAYLASNNYQVATGNAVGSDQAFARGANSIDAERVSLYLPWKTYEKSAIVLGNQIMAFSKEDEATDTRLAAAHHPAWAYLTPGVHKLMVRNAGIVRNSSAVLAWLNHNKKGFGGTGHGWRIAEALNIPRLDISDASLETVIEFLNNIVK